MTPRVAAIGDRAGTRSAMHCRCGGLPSLWGEVDRLVLDAIGFGASADDTDDLALLLERDRG